MAAVLIHRLEVLTSTQERDLALMVSKMQRRLGEIQSARTEATRKEAGEWILRVAAELYAWSR
jgi:hypothetical protein